MGRRRLYHKLRSVIAYLLKDRWKGNLVGVDLVYLMHRPLRLVDLWVKVLIITPRRLLFAPLQVEKFGEIALTALGGRHGGSRR